MRLKKRLTPKSGVSYDLQKRTEVKSLKKIGVSHESLCRIRGISEALRAGHYKECVHRSDEAMEIMWIKTSSMPNCRGNNFPAY